MPVTASYIICAVIAAPALIKLGVPDFAAHMFIFYYAVLSEVSPPTALSPFAAAAITGGDPYRTTLQSWKYTLPGVRRAVRVRARSGRRRAAAQGAAGRRRGCTSRGSRSRRAMGIVALAAGDAALAAARVHAGRAVAPRRLRPAARLSGTADATGSASPASSRCSRGSGSRRVRARPA